MKVANSIQVERLLMVCLSGPPNADVRVSISVQKNIRVTRMDVNKPWTIESLSGISDASIVFADKPITVCIRQKSKRSAMAEIRVFGYDL